MATPLHRRGWGLKAMERGVDGLGRTSADIDRRSPTLENAIAIRAGWWPVHRCALYFCRVLQPSSFHSHTTAAVSRPAGQDSTSEDWLGPAHVRRGRCAGPPIVPSYTVSSSLPSSRQEVVQRSPGHQCEGRLLAE